MTVNMKIDLAKPTERGLAVGLNEFAGYTGVAVMAALSGYVAATFSNRPEPFYIGLAVVATGLALSLLVRDTGEHLKRQAKSSTQDAALSAGEVFKRTAFKNPTLSTATFAGLSTNLKDGMAWGLVSAVFRRCRVKRAGNRLACRFVSGCLGLFPIVHGLLE